MGAGGRAPPCGKGREALGPLRPAQRGGRLRPLPAVGGRCSQPLRCGLELQGPDGGDLSRRPRQRSPLLRKGHAACFCLVSPLVAHRGNAPRSAVRGELTGAWRTSSTHCPRPALRTRTRDPAAAPRNGRVIDASEACSREAARRGRGLSAPQAGPRGRGVSRGHGPAGLATESWQRGSQSGARRTGSHGGAQTARPRGAGPRGPARHRLQGGRTRFASARQAAL